MKYFGERKQKESQIIGIVLAGAFLEGERKIWCRNLDVQVSQILEDEKNHPIIQETFPYDVGDYVRNAYWEKFVKRNPYIESFQDGLDIVNIGIKNSVAHLRGIMGIFQYNFLMGLGRHIKVLGRKEPM